MPPLVTALSASRSADAKRDFVKSARDFVNRARHLPGLPLFGAGALAAILITTVSGPFGTGGMPVPQRLAFWSLLIGINTVVWICWFTWRVRKDSDWWRAALLGSVVINLAIPAEIALGLAAVGARSPADWHSSWLHAAAISAAILLLVVTGLQSLQRVSAKPEPKGRLWRAGFRNPAVIATVAAEDHYCRISLGDGSSRLIHGRFADFAEELDRLDGAVVRRGHWVAAAAIDGIVREGRGWVVRLKDGRTVRIACSTVSDLRARGWLSNDGAARTLG